MTQPQPAFPTDDYSDEIKRGQLSGMTLRDYFAAKALNGMITFDTEGGSYIVREGEVYHDAIARVAYTYADAMMKRRAKA